MDDSFEKKCDEIKKKLGPLSAQERYQELIAMGRKLPPFPNDLKQEKFLVKGCQSALFLAARMEQQKIFFSAHSDALISAGLAALLLSIYSGQSAEAILKSPPTFIADLGLGNSLSPTRSNGLANIYLRMKQEALRLYAFSGVQS